MKNRDSGNPEYSREREFTVVLEEIRGQLKVIGEGYQSIYVTVGRLVEDVTILKSDVAVIKAVIPTLATKKEIDEFRAETNQRFEKLEGEMNQRFERLEGEMGQRFDQVDRRLSLVETHRT